MENSREVSSEGKQLRRFQSYLKVSIYLQNVAISPLLTLYPRAIKTYAYIKTCVKMFIAAFFMSTQTGNNPNVYHQGSG